MYMLNKHVVNPGFAGMENTLVGAAVYRQQWAGLVGAPRQADINVHMPMYIIGGGVGIRLRSDNRGATNDLGASLTYSYHLQVNSNNLLGVGISAGILQRGIDGSLLRAPDGSYNGEFNHFDPLLPTSRVSGIGSKIDAGFFWQNTTFGVGLGIHNLLPAPIGIDLVDGGRLEIEQNPHLTVMAEVPIDVSKSIRIVPSLLFRSDLKQHEIHLSARAYYDDFVMIGASYRGVSAITTDALVIMGGIQVNDKVFLAYSYDLTLSDLALVSQGSHEIMLNYNLGKPIGKGKLPKIIFNPRF